MAPPNFRPRLVTVKRRTRRRQSRRRVHRFPCVVPTLISATKRVFSTRIVINSTGSNTIANGPRISACNTVRDRGVQFRDVPNERVIFNVARNSVKTQKKKKTERKNERSKTCERFKGRSRVFVQKYV